GGSSPDSPPGARVPPPVCGRGVVPAARPGGEAGVTAHDRERARRGGDLPPAGRAAPGDRAGRCPGEAVPAPGTAGADGEPAEAADGGSARPAGPAAAVAGYERLELW